MPPITATEWMRTRPGTIINVCMLVYGLHFRIKINLKQKRSNNNAAAATKGRTKSRTEQSETRRRKRLSVKAHTGYRKSTRIKTTKYVQNMFDVLRNETKNEKEKEKKNEARKTLRWRNKPTANTKTTAIRCGQSEQKKTICLRHVYMYTSEKWLCVVILYSEISTWVEIVPKRLSNTTIRSEKK